MTSTCACNECFRRRVWYWNNLNPLPKGWIHKSVIYFFETMAGSEHFRNFRHFIATDGVPGLVDNRNLDIEKKKIVGSGNLGIFLLRTN